MALRSARGIGNAGVIVYAAGKKANVMVRWSIL
jgi:hypothetical protein